MKSKRDTADRDLVTVPQSNWLVNPALVKKRAVATAQINEPE